MWSTKFTQSRNVLLLTACCLLALVRCSPAEESQPATGPVAESSVQATVTAEDYERAESRLAPNTNPLVYDSILASYWQDNDQLIYRKNIPGANAYVLVDPRQGTVEELLDTASVLEVLAELNGETANAEEDPGTQESTRPLLTQLEISQDGSELLFNYEGDRYRLQRESGAIDKLLDSSRDSEFLSPDGTKAVFIEAHNLWVRNTADNSLMQLTFDGEENYGYGTNNAGWLRDDGPVLLWSPDSTKIATFRHDGRNVGDMALFDTRVGHPEIDVWKYPLPGDDFIFQIERIVIHLEDSPRIVKLDMPADPHRSSISDHVAGRNGEFLDVQWSEDSATLTFVSSSRDHKRADLRIADPQTGTVRDVLAEEVATYFESGSISENWRVLHGSREVLWFSERENWGHLYLYDLDTGRLERQLTSGSWAVMQVQFIDEEGRWVYFTGSNKEPGDPYHHYQYRISLDGGEPQLLSPEPGHHSISWSSQRDYFLDSWSTPQTPPVSVLRNSDGSQLLALETADITDLEATGWQPPESFTVKARDQQTDIYGLLYRPSNFDPEQSYPVLNYLYPGPQSGSVGSRSFRAARNDKQALAELGFIVVELDAMGTPGRSKSFHDIYYGDMGDNGLPDQIAGIRQLAERYSYMDLERVGIWGHSGGGFASTAGLLRYPEFYKVAVSGAGNHDNRNYEDDWGEKWQGLLVEYPETNPTSSGASEAAASAPATNYDNQANQLLVDNLEGKLLLAHGLMDTNVHPSNTLLVVDALIAADKDFDLLILPNAGHGFGNRRYFMKRRWDYFVTHLKNSEPPPNYVFAENIP